MPASGQTAGVAVIADPPEGSLGPAMLALSEPQRRFVVALLETGAQDNTLAATMAGYGGTDGSRKVAAWHLAHNPKVQAAIKEEADRRLRAGAILAASALVEIAGDVRHKDRFKASVELLNRAGLVVQTEHKVIVEDTRLSEEIEKGIVTLAQRLNIDPMKLLGTQPTTVPKGDIVDAEFSEVDDLNDLYGAPPDGSEPVQ